MQKSKFALVLLLFATPQPPSAAASTSPLIANFQSTGDMTKPGKIKGVVTFYFNANLGAKADVGSKVLLVSGAIQVPSDRQAVIFKDHIAVLQRKQQDGYVIPFIDQTTVDANGAFQFDDLSPGNYTVIIRSEHSVGNILTSPRDSIGRWQCIVIDVKPGRAVDASYNFPATSLGV